MFPVDVGGDANRDDVLDRTETWTYTCSVVLTVTTTNRATVTGTNSLEGTETATDSATVNVGSFIYLPLITETDPGSSAGANAAAGGLAFSAPVRFHPMGAELFWTIAPYIAAIDDLGGEMKQQRLGRTLRLALTLCLLVVVMASSMGARATAVLFGAGTVQAQAGVLTTVLEPQIVLYKLPDETTVLSGSDVQFTLAVTNTGAMTLTNVIVADLLVPDCARSLGTLLVPMPGPPGAAPWPAVTGRFDQQRGGHWNAACRRGRRR